MSEWDEPHPVAHDAQPAQRSSARTATAPAASRWSNGLFDPLALLGWLIGNSVKIGLIAAALTVLGLGAVMMIPFPFNATAIVLADPRDQRITLQEEVLPSIGTDAAVLESMVQIVRSDGFLRQVMTELKVFGETPASAEEQSRQLSKFRRNLSVERKGATYLVEISYRSDDPQEAARIANGVAEAFARSQNSSRSTATENAARSLTAQLVDARARLNASEEAVARFKADNNIVYVDERNTVQMRQLSELNQQLALVRNATEEARARYDEQRNGGALTRASGTESENGQLSYLRQQRAQLIQSRDQQSQVYGPLHPRLAQTNQAIAGIDRQISQEREVLTRQLKAELDVAVAKQAQIERQIGELSSNVTSTDTASVELDALEREAQANREQYQQLLARTKATDQLASLSSDNVRIVSEAVAPLSSTRPSLTLLAPVLAFLGFAVATVGVVATNGRSLRRRPAGTPADEVDDEAPFDGWDEPVPASEPYRPRSSLLEIRAPQAEPAPRNNSLFAAAPRDVRRAG